MNITNTSALHAGQLGVQRSQHNLDQASAQVAQASTQTASVTSTDLPDSASANLREGLIDAKVSELEVKANAKVVGAADDMLGTIIDIKA